MATITVTSPKSGDDWKLGSTHSITWTSTGLSSSDPVDIELYKGEVFTGYRIRYRTPNDGGTTWIIPINLAPDINYKIRIHISNNSSITGFSHTFTLSKEILTKMYGVTVDDVDRLSEIVTSLKSLSKIPTTRIVFDEFVPAKNYLNAAKNISTVSPIMGEILDSEYVKQYTASQYKARTIDYINTLRNYVSIWEIGNEINGEWLGTTSDVVAKMTGAYDIAKSKDVKTELTLYYNQGCWENPSNEMFAWTTKNVPDRMKKGLDYVFVSYYEDDCNGLQPNWQQVFDKLGQIFPNSYIGIGECGTEKSQATKEAYIRRYYSMKINHPRYVGGYFWWYFAEDMVPKTKYLWSVLNDVIKKLNFEEGLN